MLVDPPAVKRFLSAPPSIAALLSAILEPAVAVGLLYALHLVYAQPFDTSSVVFALFVMVLLTPGHNWVGRVGVGLWIDMMLYWVPVAAVLLLLGWATRSYHQFDRDMLLTWLVLTPLMLAGTYRALTSVLLHRLKDSRFHRPCVIVGAGPVCLRVADMLDKRKRYGWRLLGVFDERSLGRLILPPNVPFRGKVADVASFVQHQGVKDVFVTMPLSTQPRILKLLESMEDSTASVHYVPDVFGASIVQGRLEDMDGLPVVTLVQTPFTGANIILKRISDVVLALVILVIISPVLLLVTLAVRFTSKGPVIFKQDRNGLDGEVIRVYKFRTMTVIENGGDIRQATRDDDRFTPIGKFLRRTSLDELPQFLNVLQGRMSIVGPRPHAVAHNEEYRKRVRAYMARHKVRPGITGWAQIHGLRGETDTLEKMEQRVAYDLEYLRNWSLGLDLLIIARTIRQIAGHRNAY